MLKRTIRRENDQLKQRLATIIEQRDDAIRERDAAVRLSGRLASRATEASTHADRAARAWSLVVRDANQAESLFARSIDLLRRREQRHQANSSVLRQQLVKARRDAAAQRERADKLDAQVERLERANQRLDWGYVYPKVADQQATAA